MSSILKALKKLESESPKPDQKTATRGVVVDPRITVNRKVKRSWLRSRLKAGAVFVLVVLILGAGVWINRYRLAPHLSFEKIIDPVNRSQLVSKSDKSPDNPIKPKRGTMVAKSGPDPSANSEKKISGQRELSKKTDPTKVRPVAEAQPDPGPLKKMASVPAGFRSIPGPSSLDLPRPNPPLPPKKRPMEHSRPPDPVRSMDANGSSMPVNILAKPGPQVLPDPMTDGTLIVQALVWSDNTQSRMAVINGQVARIGGRVDGYQVVNIEKDYIIVEMNRRQWRVDFSLK